MCVSNLVSCDHGIEFQISDIFAEAQRFYCVNSSKSKSTFFRI